MVTVQTESIRGFSGRAGPTIDFDHCRSRSIMLMATLSTPKSCWASRVTRSKRSSGGVSTMPSSSSARCRAISSMTPLIDTAGRERLTGRSTSSPDCPPACSSRVRMRVQWFISSTRWYSTESSSICMSGRPRPDSASGSGISRGPVRSTSTSWPESLTVTSTRDSSTMTVSVKATSPPWPACWMTFATSSATAVSTAIRSRGLSAGLAAQVSCRSSCTESRSSAGVAKRFDRATSGLTTGTPPRARARS